MVRPAKQQNARDAILKELHIVLKGYRISQLDEQLTAACPFFEHDQRDVTTAYTRIHDMARSRILVKLQTKLDNISIISECPLKAGRVDGAVGGVVLKGDKAEVLLFIEIKTGNVKFVQPAVYTLLEGRKTLVAEVRTGDVFVIDAEVAETIVSALITHLQEKKALKEAGKKIPGPECRLCAVRCRYRRTLNTNPNPIRNLKAVLRNVDVIVDKLAREITRELNEISE